VTFQVLFLGDIVGPLGRKAVTKYLSTHSFDFVIANGENATHGHGLSLEHYQELRKAGIDCVTSGNHFYNNKDAFQKPEAFPDEIRPYNLDPGAPLSGTKKYVLKDGKTEIRVTNLIGRVFLDLSQSNPFYAFDEVARLDEEPVFHLVDFHAEATAEKRCFAEYADGRATAVLGTHTHVQTNDAQFLDRGTFFLTDAGMNGARDSVLGDDKEPSLYRTMTGMPAAFTVPRKGTMTVNGVILTLDTDVGRATSYLLVNETLPDSPN